MAFSVLDILHKWKHLMYGLLCLVSSTGHDVFKIHLYCSIPISPGLHPFLWLENISFMYKPHPLINYYFFNYFLPCTFFSSLLLALLLVGYRTLYMILYYFNFPFTSLISFLVFNILVDLFYF